MSTWRRDRVGPYRLKRRLRSELSGTVYRASDARNGVAVTVTELAAELVADTRFLERFRHETAVLSQLDHPSVGRILDFLEIEGRVYVVSEAIAGRTLRDVIGSTLLRPAQAMALLRGSLVGLDAAHSVRLLHRSLRPESVVLQTNGLVTLTGFGQPAYGAGAGARAALTAPGGISPYAYVAPEQVVGAETDVRTDVYLAGVLGYELLAGRPPFSSLDPAEMWSMHMAQHPPRLIELRPELTVPIVEIVGRALAKTPGARQQSAREFIGQIDAVSSPLQVWTESAMVSQLGRGAGPLVVDSLAAVESPRPGLASGGGRLGWRPLRALVPGVAALALTIAAAASDGYNPSWLSGRAGIRAGQHSGTTQGPKPGSQIGGAQHPGASPGVVQTPPAAEVPQPAAVLSSAGIALPALPVSPLLLSVVEPTPLPAAVAPPPTAPPAPGPVAPSPPPPSPVPSPAPDDESDGLPADTVSPDADDVAGAADPEAVCGVSDDACAVLPGDSEEGHGR